MTEGGEVMHGVGVLFRQAFADAGKDYYAALTTEHQFQSLTMDAKTDTAFRKGLYLTRVEKRDDDDSGDVFFRLLRCSTNLAGPTDNFRATDVEIVDNVNQRRRRCFDGTAELNHVLAQTYHNVITDDGRQKKAKISEHSDKTKDMPPNAVIAFCSFYQGYTAAKGFSGPHQYRQTSTGDFVYGRDDMSVLTRLRFRRKDDAPKDPNCTAAFDIVLYPNSVFMISLAANRTYTHEIVPSSLPVDVIPTRLGYIVRSSETQAVFSNGQTYILRRDGRREPLQPASEQGIRDLRRLYFLENTTSRLVNYDTEHRFLFSMNQGDYHCPML